VRGTGRSERGGGGLTVGKTVEQGGDGEGNEGGEGAEGAEGGEEL
jgi:hypothetical protein